MHIQLFPKKRIATTAFVVTFCIFLTSGCTSPSHSNSDNPEFEAFMEEIFHNDIAGNTLNLHYTISDPTSFGITEYVPTLGDLSKESREDSLSELKNCKKELNSFSYRSLSTREQLTYDILSDYLDSQIALADYELYQEILTPNNGIQAQLPILLAEYKFNCKQDVEDYLALLSQIDIYYGQIIDFEKEKKEAGLFMSDACCLEVISGCESFIENPTENFLIQTFDSKITSDLGLSQEEIASYKEENRSIVLKEVIPAYQTLISRLTSMLGSGKNDWGLCYFEDGKDYYELLVQSEIGTKDSIEDINQAISQTRDSDLQTCAALLEKNPELFEACNSLEWNITDEMQILTSLETIMLSDFPKPIENTYSIRYVDESLEESLAPAFYITAPIDDYTENTIYINNASNYADIFFFTTLAHEGFPGHLYQTMMSYDYGLEPVRSTMNFSGYVEGWATYVEMMSYYYAGLDEDVASMLQHNQSATLSLYASADIGIHYFGWDEEAIYNFWNNYGITDVNTINQITGLILSAPGNYLKYYVGYINFLELQNQMKKTYSDSFSLIAFHEAILRIGPAPFYVIEEHFENYYSPQTSSTKS